VGADVEQQEFFVEHVLGELTWHVEDPSEKLKHLLGQSEVKRGLGLLGLSCVC
jgi:hypothetical protein